MIQGLSGKPAKESEPIAVYACYDTKIRFKTFDYCTRTQAVPAVAQVAAFTSQLIAV